MPSFATVLKHYRRAGLSAKAISSLERGVNRYPRRETLHLLFEALHLDNEQRRLLATTRVVATADTIAVASFHSHLVDSDGDALQSHIAHLRTSKQHMVLVDALLVRAMIAVHENSCRAAMKDLDEAIALAQVLPYPDPELKASYIYGQLHSAMGDCVKACEVYARALTICNQLDEGLHRPHIERALSGVMRR
jgi:tetratricopeptide (TPR) repeat protein